MHGRTIIPVAKVKYSVGAGAGSGYEHEGTDPGEVEGGQGEGAGGSFQVKPVGIYDVTAEKSVYQPIVPVELIILLPLMMTGLAFLMAASRTAWIKKKRGRIRMGTRCKTKGQGMKMKGMGHSD